MDEKKQNKVKTKFGFFNIPMNIELFFISKIIDTKLFLKVVKSFTKLKLL